MVNTDKLRGKITERRKTIGGVAKEVGMNAATLRRRINGGGGAFTIDEADKIASALDLTPDELNNIFFAQYVAQYANKCLLESGVIKHETCSTDNCHFMRTWMACRKHKRKDIGVVHQKERHPVAF